METSELDLSSRQVNILKVVASAEKPPTLMEVSQRLGIAGHTVWMEYRILAAKGLLSLEPGTWRGVSMTEEGRKAIAG